LDALNALGADKPDLKNNPNFQKIFQLFTDANNQGAVQERAIDTWILNELDFEGSGNSWNRLSSYARERNAEIDLLKKRLFEI
jgi:aspartyl-tRNA synthetase